ncbi:MAG: hypothetical protein Q4D81_15245, partial [Eubacteriales bacterium]|nr:hypothetical protein [Eubacteriales bacterium]
MKSTGFKFSDYSSAVSVQAAAKFESFARLLRAKTGINDLRRFRHACRKSRAPRYDNAEQFFNPLDRAGSTNNTQHSD